MKKITALIFMLSVMLSLGTVSMASEEKGSFTVYNSAKIYNEDVPSKLSEYSYPDNQHLFGESVYFPVRAHLGDGLVFSSDDLIKDFETAKKFKVSAIWSEGGEYVESVSLSPLSLADEEGKIQKVYFLDVKIKENLRETETVNVKGTVSLYSKEYGARGNSRKIDVEFPVCNLKSEDYNTSSQEKIYSFENGKYELGLYDDNGKFIIDAKDQKDIVIKTEMFENSGIENIPEGINYNYYSGSNATFNRPGELLIYSPEKSYLYRVNANGTLTAAKPPYDEEEGAFRIKTRVIGSYVSSERELDLNMVNK